MQLSHLRCVQGAAHCRPGTVRGAVLLAPGKAASNSTVAPARQLVVSAARGRGDEWDEYSRKKEKSKKGKKGGKSDDDEEDYQVYLEVEEEEEIVATRTSEPEPTRTEAAAFAEGGESGQQQQRPRQQGYGDRPWQQREGGRGGRGGQFGGRGGRDGGRMQRNDGAAQQPRAEGEYQPRRDGGNGYQQRRDGAGGGYQRREGGQQQRREGEEGREGGQSYGRYGMSPEQMAVRQVVNTSIKEATTWQQLATILSEHSAAVDAENVVQMMFKICKDPKPKDDNVRATYEQFVASLFGFLSQYIPTLRPRQIALAVYSIAKLEYFNNEMVAGLAQRGSVVMGNFSDWEYAHMLWGFARMNYSPGTEWLNSYVFWTERKLQNFRPVELTNTITSMAKLGHVPPLQWGEAFGKALVDKASDFNNLELVNVLFSMASLGLLQTEEPAEWLGKLLSDPQRCDTFKVQDLTRLSWALTQATWRPQPDWMAALTTSFIRQLRYCQPSDLATISYSLAYLRAAPSPNGVDMVVRKVEQCWGTATADELANLAMALAIWQFKPRERWMDELVIAVVDKLPTASPDALSKIVSALPVLGSGYRVSQAVTQAQTLLNGLSGDAAQQVPAEAQLAA